MLYIALALQIALSQPLPPPSAWREYRPSQPGAAAASYSRPSTPDGTWSITVPASCPASFYHFFTPPLRLSGPAVYEFSALALAERTEDGVGVFITATGLADDPSRRTWSAGSERLLGGEGWRRLNCFFYIPPGSHPVRLLMLLHGRGSARFRAPSLRRLASLRLAGPGAAVSATISAHPLTRQFLGFGVEDDSFFFTDENLRHGITPADVALRQRRIAQLNPSVICTLLWWNAFNPSGDLDTLRTDTELMRALVRTLRPHQLAGRTVILADTHWGRSGPRFAYAPANARRSARLYARAIHYLVRQQGLACIRYVSVCGENDLRFRQMGGTFASYLEAVRTLRAELNRLGLRGIKLLADKTSGTVWLSRVIRAIDPLISFYAVHEYLDVTQYPIAWWRLAEARCLVQSLSAPIPMAGASWPKPIFAWEIGYRDMAARDTDRRATATHRFSYGLLCAHTAIAAIKQGFAGGSLWCLHSMYYPGQNRMDFGLWEFKDRAWRLRPAYFAWGLFTRFARRGMLPLAVSERPDFADVSLAALKDRSGRLVIFAVNLSRHPVRIRLCGAAGPAQLYLYEETRIRDLISRACDSLDALTAGRLDLSRPFTLPPRCLAALLQPAPR